MLPSASWVTSKLPVTDGPGVATGSSVNVVPPFVEYSNFATATSSVADRFTVTGPLRNQLLRPGVGFSVATLITGDAASVPWAYAAGPAKRRPEAAASPHSARVPLLSPPPKCVGVLPPWA